MITATRYHDISCGHRVVGQGGKCEFLHGHNYRFHFTIMGDLDEVGRVIDFGVIKSTLCDWLELHWDHKFLVWFEDPWHEALAAIDPNVVWMNENPTAENLAKVMVDEVGPELLKSTGVKLVSCTVDETRKCSATFSLDSSFDWEALQQLRKESVDV